jgi:hypothetical protein
MSGIKAGPWKVDEKIWPQKSIINLLVWSSLEGSLGILSPFLYKQTSRMIYSLNNQILLKV